MLRSDKRAVVRIVNPAPDSEPYTSMKRADGFIAARVADWVIPGEMIRFTDQSPAVRIRMEMAARARKEQLLDTEIGETRYGCISWGGDSRTNIPWWEREGMVPIRPGKVIS